MRTLLSQFCEEFDSSVRPLLAPLKRSAETLAEVGDRPFAKALLPTLLDVADQFTVLADKVKEQQAYVLIFGPLKSGKSTLMNAMSAAYVSEVTSLPAYPCMVYVSDSKKREFTVTRYNGDQEIFHDPAALRMQVARAHKDLAEHTRRVEGEGKEFDPGLHFDEAIRRIDVKVPAGELAQSGSVLVDTPGLYSRMKFGYDRMTKEFRNAAACAIFVVKTDNLFLEQVFNEFNELLDLFSRIFLVVNLDSTKMDLMPDGTLAPSLESDDPIRVVEAFENLAMSAPLKAAADEGRLRIYPVDLRNAASRRLSGAHDRGEAEAQGFSTSGQADFDEFMRDLSDYLNSTDYLVAFLGDSLRRALGLLGEAQSACEHTAVEALEREVEQLEGEQARTQAKLEALERLRAYDWEDSLADLKAELLNVGREVSAGLSESTAHDLSDALDRWFQGDASLKALVQNDLEPLLESSQRQLALSVHERLTRDVAEGAAGVRLPHQVARDLVTLGLQFNEFGRGALDHVDPVAGVRVEGNPLPLDEIPVKKSLLDWLFFRSQARVRRRMFGAPESPSLRVPREHKQKRLGEPARRVMQALLGDFQQSRIPALLDALTLRIYEDYADAVTAALAQRFERRAKELGAERARLDGLLREDRKVLNRLEELAVTAGSTRLAIEELAARYREADPSMLVQPLGAPESALPKPANLPDLYEDEAPADAPAEAAAEVELELETEE
ncbi:MAG: dynamin family protein [Planctomycetes bacterium]|nr:dynamin family protein [Planctomycetota bacterium]